MTETLPVKSGRPTASPGQVKKDLLSITVRLLNTVGRKGATARAICKAAGVGAPVIYYHYGDLNGLHQAAIEESFRSIASCYRRSTKAKGPLQGIRDAWALFMHFAHEEPRMCRIMIEQILAGDPPKAIARTLRSISKDIASLDAAGRLNFSPETVSQMLWVAAFGAVGFISTERSNGREPAPEIQEAVLKVMLNALFEKPAERKQGRALASATAGQIDSAEPI